ncbi:MAG: hypothetical protein JW864_02810 [Spirochaetes bacterium]|nr:hypothetical protein [Spirochaetota bacterium]
MNYEIMIPESKKFILCRIKKPVTIDFSREFMLETEQAGIRHNISHFLFDARNCRNVEKIHKTYRFIHEEMNELGLRRSSRVAILVSTDDDSHDFVEVVCKNTGYNVKLFTDQNKAVRWLNDDETSNKMKTKFETDNYQEFLPD